MAEHQLTCAHCGAQFVTDHKRKYCTKRCNWASQGAKRNIKLGRLPRWSDQMPRQKAECVCIVCDKAFIPKQRDRTKCCSRECGTLFAGFRTRAHANGCRVSVRIVRKKCVECGHRHSRQGALCGPECSKVRVSNQARTKGQADHVSTAIICHECAATFVPQYGNKSRKFCSSQCLTKNMRRIGRTRRDDRIRSSARRETVDPIKVFIRDGWRCQICKRQTPLRLRGTNKPRAPELDHILPLACGGDHTYANTQCTCRECNGMKGATPKGQLMLFPTA